MAMPLPFIKLLPFTRCYACISTSAQMLSILPGGHLIWENQGSERLSTLLEFLQLISKWLKFTPMFIHSEPKLYPLDHVFSGQLNGELSMILISCFHACLNLWLENCFTTCLGPFCFFKTTSIRNHFYDKTFGICDNLNIEYPFLL